MKRRSFISIAAGITLLLSVSACSGGTGGSSPTSAAIDPKGDLTGVTLTLWTAQSSATEADQVIDTFQKATGAKITKVVIPDPYETNVPAKFATGSKPDILFYSAAASTIVGLQPSKNLLPLDNESWVPLLNSSVKDIGVTDGVRYTAPVTATSTIGVFYNKDDFTKAGVTSLPTKFSELVDVAKKVKAAGMTPFYEAGADKWPTAWMTDIQLADEAKNNALWAQVGQNKAKWTDATFVKAVTNYETVVNSGLTNDDYKTGTFVNQGADLFSGKAAMAVQLNALLDEISATHTPAEVDKTLGFFPVSTDGTVASIAPDSSNSVALVKSGNEKQQNAARQFLDFWLGPDYADFIKATNRISIQTATPTPDTVSALAKTIASASENSTLDMYTAPVVHVNVFLYTDNLLFGQMTPDQVAAACQQEFEQGAKAQGLPGF